jgi:hypothetical protein
MAIVIWPTSIRLEQSSTKKWGKQSLAEADLKKSRLNQKTLYKEIYEPDKEC